LFSESYWQTPIAVPELPSIALPVSPLAENNHNNNNNNNTNVPVFDHRSA
jgi:hypothetical protein